MSSSLSLPGAGQFATDRPPWRGLELRQGLTVLTKDSSAPTKKLSLRYKTKSSSSTPNLRGQRSELPSSSSSQSFVVTRGTPVVRPKARHNETLR